MLKTFWKSSNCKKLVFMDMSWYSWQCMCVINVSVTLLYGQCDAVSSKANSFCNPELGSQK